MTFALAVFFCDGYLNTRSVESLEEREQEDARREEADAQRQDKEGSLDRAKRSRTPYGKRVQRLSQETTQVEATESQANSSSKWRQALRFLQILRHMPIELQMVLCNHTYGVSRQLILSKDAELAFREILRRF